jgi:hypothetical protein
MQGERGIAHRSRSGKHLRMIRDGRAVDLRHGLTQLLAGGSNIGTRRSDGIAGVRQLLSGNGAIRDEAAAPSQIVVGSARRLLSLGNLFAQLLTLCE